MKMSLLLPVLVLALFQVGSGAFAQTFDERMSDWPTTLKINGTVMASSDGHVEERLVEYFRVAAGSDEARIVSINYSRDSQTDVAATRFNPAATHVHFESGDQLMDDSEDSTDVNTPGHALKNATGVWITADSELDRAQKAQVQSITDELEQLIERGGVLFTSGAITQSLGRYEITGGQLFGDSRQPSVKQGLHLIPDVVVQTMFDSETARPRLMGVMGSHPRAVGVGLDPETTMVLRGRKIRAMGKGQVHFFTMANEELPLRVKAIADSGDRRTSPYESLVDLTAWRRDAIDRTLDRFPPAEPEKPFVENGTLMIIGGGGMPDGMMDRFVELAGGEKARLVYVPCSERDEITSRDSRLVQAWERSGVASAHVIHTKDREKANTDEEFLKPLKTATGIFFGGGRQWNFADSYYGTETHRLMKDVLARGGVIAGSSAGASIQARYLARANPLGNVDIMAPGYERGGLGFISGVAIDQHFSQRGRHADMSSLVNRHPQLLGIGIDERTAIVVQKSIAEVVGNGKVFLYDRNQHPAHIEPDHAALEEGDRYDLATREIIE